MRRAALAATFLGLLGTALGCKSTFGRCDCLNDPTCQPLPAYSNPTPVVGPTQSGAIIGTPIPTGSTPDDLPPVSVPMPDRVPVVAK